MSQPFVLGDADLYARYSDRAQSTLLDLSIQAFAAWATAVLLGSVTSDLVRGIAVIAIVTLYWPLTEYVWQRTPGKAILGVRLVGRTGDKPDVGDVVSRQLLRGAVLTVAYTAGLGAPLVLLAYSAIYRRRDRTFLHDRMSFTRVLRTRHAPPSMPSSSQLPVSHSS